MNFAEMDLDSEEQKNENEKFGDKKSFSPNFDNFAAFGGKNETFSPSFDSAFEKESDGIEEKTKFLPTSTWPSILRSVSTKTTT